MDLKVLLLYFILGGTVVSVVTYLGVQGRGLLAAFIANFPSITVLTFYFIGSRAGPEATLSYARGLLILTPPWVLYVLCLLYLLPRWGMGWALVTGTIVYVLVSALLNIMIHR